MSRDLKSSTPNGEKSLTTPELRKLVDSRKLQKEVADKQLKAASQELDEAKAECTAVDQALTIAEAVARTVQQVAHKRITAVVSRALAAVFDDPYEFDIKFERKRGKTEAALKFIRRGHELTPVGGAGGGPIDVAAFALRMASLVLSRPPARRLLLLDEPFKAVHSIEYRERVRGMLEELAKDMGVQIVMSTGIEEFKTGKVVEID